MWKSNVRYRFAGSRLLLLLLLTLEEHLPLPSSSADLRSSLRLHPCDSEYYILTTSCSSSPPSLHAPHATLSNDTGTPTLLLSNVDATGVRSSSGTSSRRGRGMGTRRGDKGKTRDRRSGEKGTQREARRSESNVERGFARGELVGEEGRVEHTEVAAVDTVVASSEEEGGDGTCPSAARTES